MGSTRGNGRGQGPGRRRKPQDRFGKVRPGVESLEIRSLLSGAGEAPPSWRPTTTDLHDARNGPLALAGQQLITTYFNYETYLQSGKTTAFDSGSDGALGKILLIRNNYVDVDIRGYGDFNAFKAELVGAGMMIGTVDPALEMVEGAIPIGSLPTFAALSQIVNIVPVFQPTVDATPAAVKPPVSGIAPNQSDQVLGSDLARAQYGVTGAGVTVGAISNSANRYLGGLADSIRTGDLPASVRILPDASGNPADGQPGDDDEGRAMLEQIHDIAPGANLLFSSGESPGNSAQTFPDAGELYMAQSIQNLASAGAQVVVDDLGYPTEPYYQDGPIAQAVTNVVNSGVTYFSSAHNSGNGGYQSQFRGVNATVTGVGTGRFMNFNPNNGPAATSLKVTVSSTANIDFQYDDPFYTNNGVTSDLRIFFVDATTGVDVALDTTNKIAQKAPLAIVQIPAGTYNVSIQVLTGPDVGHVAFFQLSGTSIAVDQSNGTAGGTFYPTTFGHNASASDIGVGAVPWFDALPFNVPAGGVKNEQFSSTGPAISVFDANGIRRVAPQILQKPDISSVDGNDTSFFPPGGQLQTTNPPPGTGPATPTELDNNQFPNFFGTSSAAPNLAAVAALMKQLNPTATPGDIRTALVTTAAPIDGQAPGSYNIQAGFGLAQAVPALGAVQTLRVQAASPSAGQVLTTAPQFIDITFNKAINFATLSAASLVITEVPAGANVLVGAPIQISATVVRFPLIFQTITPETPLNGRYGFVISGAGITSLDGKPLVTYGETFTINDVTAPQVTGTIELGRIVVVQFSKAMRASTITTGNIALYRTNTGGVLGDAATVDVLSDPRAAIYYDAVNNRAIIDLNGLDQTELTSGHYYLAVSDSVTDVVGNRLDGEFIGLYPSGNGAAGGTFVQDLGNITLSPPIVASLSITAATDTGQPGDQNTALQQPVFTGAVRNPFPGTVANLQVAVQFSGPRGNTNDLAVGQGGRGFSGTPDLIVNTDANGAFTFKAPFPLADGLQSVRVVVVGQNDLPVQPGLSSQFDDYFRIDTSNPTVVSSVPASGSPVSQLTSVSLNVVDPVNPAQTGNPLGVPTQLDFSALDPATADNISNYKLFNLGPNRTQDALSVDESNFILGANFVSTTSRAQTGDPYTGRIDLTLAPGLPAGLYALYALGFNPATGNKAITDAAGNPLDANLAAPGLQNYFTLIDLQPAATYVTAFQTVSNDPNGTTAFNGPKGYYEIPAPGTTARADAPPSQINIDFSTPLNPLTITNETVQLMFSPDGVFDGQGADATLVAGTTVTQKNSNPSAVNSSMPGFQNRLTLNISPNVTLAPGHYRVIIPNSNGNVLLDIYGSQLDGEFLGNPTGTGSFEDLLPNGQYRAGLSGDGIAGGTFESGFLVVPNGNVIYARPDYAVQSFDPTTAPDGSLAKPYPTLAPQAAPNALNGGDLNSFVNYGTGFQQVTQDREQSGHFDPSAFFAAQVASARGPVVIVALPAQAGSKTFVLDLPPQTDPNNPTQVLNGSASVPFNTTLVFDPGSTLRLYNAALFAQNQGSAIQLLGTPTQRVTFTSFYDPQFGSNSPTAPRGGDWGGIVYRNFDQGGLLVAGTGGTTGVPARFTTRPDVFPIDGQLKGTNGGVARVGDDEAMSIVNFATLRYGGGSVPQTLNTGYDVIDMFNSRVTVTNTRIADSAPPANDPTRASGAQGAIGADFDSFRQDALAWGPLIRRDQFVNNSINGVLLRAQPDGAVQQSDAVLYPDNPLTQAGARNFVFDSPVPFVLASRFELGNMYVQDSGSQRVAASNRTYIQPGSLFKFERGAGIDVFDATDPLGRHTSLNIGDRAYLNQFDTNPFFGPTNLDGTTNPSFRANTTGDAQVLFTSFYDNNATTQFIDPVTGQATTIVAPNDTANGGGVYQPTPGNVPDNARWGGISIRSGVVAVINEATFQYGGGSVNTPGGTISQRAVLNFQDAIDRVIFPNGPGSPGIDLGGSGTHVSVTNDNFYDNLDTPMMINPDGLLAADPLRPLISGAPFFRGNVMQRNTYNGLGVSGGELDVNSVWDSTDLTFFLRGTIFLAGDLNNPANTGPRLPSSTVFLPQITPHTTLTIQSLVPGLLLANGQSIAKPGESTVVKLLGAGPTKEFSITPNIFSATVGGAGFIVGADRGLPGGADLGFNSQIRILGVGGNEALGQQRVPVIITSAHDSTVGTTVRGVTMNQLITGDTQAPAAGDGGIIYFGADSLYSYNLFDLREGNRIDNADLKYMSRVEMQGGGIYDQVTGNPFADFTGETFLTQNNAKRGNAVTNTNIANFRDVGIYEHPGFGTQPLPVLGSGTDLSYGPIGARLAGLAEGIVLFLVNSTIANTPIGVQVNGSPFAGQALTSTDAVLLHNTFNNDAQAFRGDPEQTNNLPGNGNFLAMDSIFANSTTAGINDVPTPLGPAIFGQSQYNDFFNNGFDANITNDPTPEISGNPLFRNPAVGNYNLLERSNGAFSSAIDAARSELGPSFFGGLLTPISTQTFLPGTGTLDPSGISIRNKTDRDGTSFVTLPGLPGKGFADEFQAVLPGVNGSTPGPASNAGTFNYIATSGARDQAGFLRQDDPNVPNVGFGFEPFFDIGAFEYRQLFPPHVVAVTATNAANPGGVSIYQPAGLAGSNQTPTSIRIQFNNLIDPTTINAQSVLLEASGGDGIFGNNNSPLDRFINLSGKLSFDNATQTLIIDLAGSGLTLTNDEYRVILEGTGPNVLRDPQGNILDGENIDPANPNQNSNQLPLPSGDGVPGGNFQVTFTVDTHPPAIVAGTFGISPTSDSNKPDTITNINPPSFEGYITDVFPPSNFLQGQKVQLDISSQGNGVYDIINAGTATTDALGHFVVTPTVPLPFSPYNVGPDGILHTNDDGGYSLARVTVVDQAGNVSNANDPNAVASFVVDTTSPVVIEATPVQNTVVTPSNGTVQVSFAVNENIDPSTLNAGTITAVRSGGDGVFGPTGSVPDVPLTIVTSSIQVTPLHTAKGAELITFNISGATANDSYQVTLGSGITDIAGNPLVPQTVNFVVFDQALARTIFVSPPTTTTTGTTPTGSRALPYPTIARGLAAAQLGDLVAVLPGIYNETVVLKGQVRLVSAATTSTDSNVVPGDPLQTIIRPNAATGGGLTNSVVAVGLTGVSGIPTEIAGFSIASPLGNGDLARGPIVIGSAGIDLENSSVLVDRNYILDNYRGVNDVEGPNALHSQFKDNVFVGNTYGLVYNTAITLPSDAQTTDVTNNTFAFNLFGIYDIGFATSPSSLVVANNIFWQNDRQQAGGGAAIASTQPGKMAVEGNMFFANGTDQVSPSDDTLNVGGGFDPAALSTTPDAAGNFVGNPAFVAPRDPRGQYDGPAIFFREGNFDLTASSAAIDSAINSLAPTVDILGRARIKVTGRGVPYGGPADVGAFEYQPATGGTAVTTPLTSLNSQAANQAFTNGFNVNGSFAPDLAAAIAPAVTQSIASTPVVTAPAITTTTPTTLAPAAPPVSVPATPPPAAAPVSSHPSGHGHSTGHHSAVRKVLSAFKRSKKH